MLLLTVIPMVYHVCIHKEASAHMHPYANPKIHVPILKLRDENFSLWKLTLKYFMTFLDLKTLLLDY